MQIQEKKNTKMKTIDMVYAALFAVLIAVCAWVTFPIGTIPLTMQTFGCFGLYPSRCDWRAGFRWIWRGNRRAAEYNGRIYSGLSG